MSQHGGPRPGSGRPPGSLSRISAKLIQKAEEKGMEMPHEFLMRLASGAPIEQLVVDKDTGAVIGTTYIVPDMDTRKDAAKAAAPYFAPKLSTVETVGSLTDEQLDEIIERAAAEAGIGLGVDGEGEAEQAQAVSARVRRSARDGAGSATTH